MVRDTSQFIGDVTGLALLGLTMMLMDLLVLTRYYWNTEVYRCFDDPPWNPMPCSPAPGKKHRNKKT